MPFLQPMKFLFSLFLKPISWIFGFLLSIVAFVVMISLALALTFNYWIPTLSPFLIKTSSGFRGRVGKSQSNVFTLRFDFFDIDGTNSDKFPASNFFKINRLAAHLSPLSFFTKRVVVHDLTLDLPEITYVKNDRGEVNIQQFLGDFLASKKPYYCDWPPKTEQGKTNNGKRIFFRQVNLRVGHLVLMDYSRGPLKVSEVKLNYEITLTDVYGDQIVDRLMKDLSSRGLRAVVNGLVDGLKQDQKVGPLVNNFLKRNDLGETLMNKAKGHGKGLQEKLKNLFKK